MNKDYYIYWIEPEYREAICKNLGLSTMVTVNKKTRVIMPSIEVYNELCRLSDKNILRLTLKP